MRKLSIYTLLFFATITFSCGSKEVKKKDAEKSVQPAAKGNTIIFNDEQIKNGGIDTGKLSDHKLTTDIHVNGKVDVPPQSIISVNVPMGGFLKSTTMLPGEPVHKGQVIARISNQDYITIQQDYLISTSRIAFLKQELDRQRELSRQQASPLKIYQRTLSEYNSEVAQAAGAAQKLRLIGINPQTLSSNNIRSVINITAPISGFVSTVNVNVGKYINPTDVIMELVNTDDIHAALTVFEQDISKIAVGSKVAINFPSLPGKVYPGQVILIGRMLDSTHSVMVHCHFLKSDKNLLPNMFLQATIRTKPKEVKALPDAALVNFEGKPYAFIATKQKQGLKFNMVQVTVGAKVGGWNEVSFSKPEFMERLFVLKGAFSILSAMKNSGDED